MSYDKIKSTREYEIEVRDMKKWIFQIILLLITVGIFGCMGSDMGNQTLTTETKKRVLQRKFRDKQGGESAVD